MNVVCMGQSNVGTSEIGSTFGVIFQNKIVEMHSTIS